MACQPPTAKEKTLRIWLALLSLALALGVAEWGLRLAGKIPGHVPRYPERQFKYTTCLQVTQNFFTDGEGVFKASADHEYNRGLGINADGFRSIPFKFCETSAVKILFLGDSFVWGAAANPLTNGFADLVASGGYVVYNTGIPGTGPNQYAFLAEKYVPALKPDVVAVMLHLGNDLERTAPMVPNRNVYHFTNAGGLWAFDDNGNYMEPQQAYDYYMSKNNLAYPYLSDTNPTAKSAVRRLFMKSVIGTYAWVRAAQLRDRILNRPAAVDEPDRRDYATALNCLRRIRTACGKSRVRFMLFIIPAHPGVQIETRHFDEDLRMLAEFRPFVPEFLTQDDYAKLPNQHFTNSGHWKYARFILLNL